MYFAGIVRRMEFNNCMRIKMAHVYNPDQARQGRLLDVIPRTRAHTRN
jgi:hypothetical protein